MRPRFWSGDLRRTVVEAAIDRRGLAAIELSMIAPLLIIGLLNTVDIARYLYQRMAVQNASQMGAQAAWKTCDPTHLPATQNCSGLNAALTAAVQDTPLGNAVTVASGFPTEGYYCVNSSNALVYVSDVSSKPADCSSVGNAGATPGDFIKVQVSFSYTPVFGSLSIARTFPSLITSTSLMRLR